MGRGMYCSHQCCDFLQRCYKTSPCSGQRAAIEGKGPSWAMSDTGLFFRLFRAHPRRIL